MKAPLKILMLAYACEPGRGSEPGVGWNTADRISRHHHVWVITRSRHMKPIQAEFAARPNPNLRVIACDLGPRAASWERGKAGEHLYYRLWQRAALPVARRLHRQIGFDLLHHVTFANYWTPSLLACLDAPFLWGPLGGAESAPLSFWRTFGLRGMAYEVVRGTIRWLAERDPYLRRTARRSTLAMGTTRNAAGRLERIGCRSVRIASEAGLNLEDLARLERSDRAGPLRFATLGQLVSLKGYHLAIEAFARAGIENSELWVFGDGPERDRLEVLGRPLGKRIRFWGDLPRREALGHLTECDVLVHPSLHDSGGWACLEGMAAGLPVICLDLGGPAQQVTAETGIKVPALDPESSIGGIAAAMKRMQDRNLRARMGREGRRRVLSDFEWSSKSKRLEAVYHEVLRG